ncbi:response regulator [Streptomyces sp. NPDC005963]|uniref:response regulator n=1 Tax=Streptomyces sp. NPDC005963 TaxID=3156721 RepID=UPI0033E37F8F
MSQRRKKVDRERLLVAVNSAEDADAFGRALGGTHPHLRLEFISSGDGIAERLLAARTLPALVLLDQLPGHGDPTLVRTLRAHPELKNVTVVVVTSSTAPSEVESWYAAGADSYVYKPGNFALFRTVLKGAIDYWQDAASPMSGSLHRA